MTHDLYPAADTCMHVYTHTHITHTNTHTEGGVSLGSYYVCWSCDQAPISLAAEIHSKCSQRLPPVLSSALFRISWIQVH